MRQDEAAQGTPPSFFLQQVKQALDNLYDLGALQRHPLALSNDNTPGSGSATPGQGLQRMLLSAIEALSPGARVSVRAPHARLYNLLRLHYVERRTAAEAALELGISRRQAHRDLRRGEANVAAILWAQRGSLAAPAEVESTGPQSAQEEVQHLQPLVESVDLRDLLAKAQATVARLAEQRGVCLADELPPQPLIVSTDGAIAQQVLTNALSCAVRCATSGFVRLRLTDEGSARGLAIEYTAKESGSGRLALDPVATQLAERLGWHVQHAYRADGSCSLTVRMAPRQVTVLVIDDNAGLVTLLERYLTGHACRVLAASGGEDALRLAAQNAPDAVFLDVMMPGMDGWEVLQRLRLRPQTAATPVIICSVFNDPDLAYSLGATSCLKKPVRREDVLAALRQVGVL